MATLPNHTLQALAEKRPFLLGDYMSQGWALCQRELGMFIGYAVLSFVLSFMVGVLPYGIGNIGGIIIGGALAVGFFVGAHALKNQRSLVFSDFFNGFQRWQPLAIARMLVSFIQVLLLLPLLFYMVHLLGGWQIIVDAIGETDQTVKGEMIGKMIENNFTPMAGLIMFLLLIPVFIVSFFYTASFFFIWFYNLTAWEGMEASRRLVTQNFGMLLLFNFIWGLIFMVSFIPCGLGLLFTIPAFMCSQYLAFAHLTGLNDSDEEQKLDMTEHFITP